VAVPRPNHLAGAGVLRPGDRGRSGHRYPEFCAADLGALCATGQAHNYGHATLGSQHRAAGDLDQPITMSGTASSRRPGSDDLGGRRTRTLFTECYGLSCPQRPYNIHAGMFSRLGILNQQRQQRRLHSDPAAGRGGHVPSSAASLPEVLTQWTRGCDRLAQCFCL
jgi:hypothetical protein